MPDAVKTRQKAINDKAEIVKPDLLTVGTDASSWITGSVSNGDALVASLGELDHDLHDLFKRLRERPESALAEAKLFFDQHAVGGRESQNMILHFFRQSQPNSRIDIKIGAQVVPAHQAAMSYAYLQLEDHDLLNGRSHVSISTTARRCSAYIPAVGALCVLIARERPKELMMTSSTRITQLLPYFTFVDGICEHSKTKIVLTECIDIPPMAVAGSEQTRITEEREAYRKYADEVNSPTSDLGANLSRIVNVPVTSPPRDSSLYDTAFRSLQTQRIHVRLTTD